MTENSDRIMVVWEEFLNKMCNEPAIPDEGNPAATRGHQMLVGLLFRSRDRISRWFLPQDSGEVRSWHCFYTVSLAVAVMGMRWSGIAGGEKTMIDLCASSKDLFFGCVVGLPVSVSRVPWGHKIISSAVVSVLMLRVLIRLAGFFLVRDLLGVELLVLVKYHNKDEVLESGMYI